MTTTTTTTTTAKPSPDDVLACQFSSWYKSFRNIDKSAINNSTARKTRKNVTFESIVIKPLPHEFLEYLKSDGVRLPDCATKVSSCMNDNATPDDDEWDTESDDETTSYSFPSLTAQIQSALDSLNGDRHLGCMPKMNWSSPRDATWMNQGSLKCTKVGDIYLLLKSSEFVTFDVEMAFDDLAEDDNISAGSYPDCFSHELVLRKWCNLHPSMEFRCFVRDHELIGISQRHPTKFYGHLQPPEDGSAHPCVEMLSSFFETYVRRRFADGRVSCYVLDVYLDSQERVWVVDFNVWGSRTDGLLFTWEELANFGDDEAERDPELRVVTKNMKSSHLTYDPLSSFRGPTDVVNLMQGANGTSDQDLGDIPTFQDFMKQCVRPSEM